MFGCRYRVMFEGARRHCSGFRLQGWSYSQCEQILWPKAGLSTWRYRKHYYKVRFQLIYLKTRAWNSKRSMCRILRAPHGTLIPTVLGHNLSVIMHLVVCWFFWSLSQSGVRFMRSRFYLCITVSAFSSHRSVLLFFLNNNLPWPWRENSASFWCGYDFFVLCLFHWCGASEHFYALRQANKKFILARSVSWHHGGHLGYKGLTLFKFVHILGLFTIHHSELVCIFYSWSRQGFPSCMQE
jgi:hypothetical protein